MKAPKNILDVWKRFDNFPMDTLTKGWLVYKKNFKRQRDVELMKEHKENYGMTGNCFDLALWLYDEFQKEGIESYFIGSHFHTPKAHVGVIAEDESGNRFLCDLGDQWIQPILIDPSIDFTEEKIDGFFPGAKVKVIPSNEAVVIEYYRPNGKMSSQTYETKRIELDEFMEAANHSQSHVRSRVLLECRIPYKDEIAHWEFYNWESFLSTTEGLYRDQPLETIEDWADRIHEKTGYNRKFLVEALSVYKDIQIFHDGK